MYELSESATEIIDEYTPNLCDGEVTFGPSVQGRGTIYTAAFDYTLLESELLSLCKSDL